MKVGPSTRGTDVQAMDARAIDIRATDVKATNEITGEQFHEGRATARVAHRENFSLPMLMAEVY